MSPETRRPSTRRHWLPGRVPRRVQQLDVDAADGHDVSRLVRGQVVGRRARSSCCTHGASADWTWTGHVDVFEQRGHALDGVPHHRAADVIGVVVRGDHAGHPHAVGGDRCEQVGHGVGGIDEDTVATRAVADGVHEVDHLTGERVVDGEVAVRSAAGGSTTDPSGVAARHDHAPYAGPVSSPLPLERLEAGQAILVGSDRYVTVGADLAAAFRPGDRVVVVAATGDLLHVPAAEHGGRHGSGRRGASPRSPPSAG